MLVCYSGTAFVTDVMFSLLVYKEGNVGKGFLSILAAAPWASPMSERSRLVAPRNEKCSVGWTRGQDAAVFCALE